MAKDFEGLVKMNKRFQVVVPRNFSTVVFRISPLELGGAADDLSAQLLESLNESGKIFVTHAVVGGDFVVRFAIGASLTENRHIVQAWGVIQEHANSLLLNMP